MKYDYEGLTKLARNIFIGLITKYSKEHGGDGDFRKIKEWKSLPSELDITLKFNDVEVDFLDFVNKYRDSFNDEVQKEAKRLMKEKITAPVERLYERVSQLDNYIKRRISNDFPHVEDDDEY